MKSKKIEIKTKNEENGLLGLAGLFDLLAMFDYEDKKRSTLSTDSLVSAPKESVLSVNQEKLIYERAEKKTIKK